MSGASTEPCRGRRIPGLARCTEAMKRGRQLHPSRAPGEPQSGFPGTVRVQFLDWLLASLRSASAACGQGGRRPGCAGRAGLLSLLFDKVVDMPVFDRLQYVDKVVDFPACRSC